MPTRRIHPVGPEREVRRSKGQFWTPDWVTDAMMAFAAPVADTIFEPGFGAGAFARAATRWSDAHQHPLGYGGCETDAEALLEARTLGTDASAVDGVALQDFLDVVSLPPRASIVANPPYIRHHRLDAARKHQLQQLSLRAIGRTLDGRTGLHAFFLIHALTLLEEGQRLAFIVPADVCEGVYAPRLWAWIGRNFRLHAVVTFAPEATPFPGVDTNAVVLLISRTPPTERYSLVQVRRAGTDSLRRWINEPANQGDDIQVQEVDLGPALGLGVSRRPLNGGHLEVLVFGDLFYTLRGVATGANDFFCLTSREIADRDLPIEFFVRTVLRTRDVPGDNVTEEQLDALDAAERPTFLLNLDATPEAKLPRSVRRYLEEGAALGLPQRALIAQRRPWYKMERRKPPSFLFAYLGRRNSRFIENAARVIPSTSFLCVYDRDELSAVSRQAVASLLADPELFAGLPLVAKSYGGGAFKVEPRSLERLPFSSAVRNRHSWTEAFLREQGTLFTKNG